MAIRRIIPGGSLKMRIAFYVARHPGETITQTPPSLQFLAGYLIGKQIVKEQDIIFSNSADEAIRFLPDIVGISSVSQCVGDAINAAKAVHAKLPSCWLVLGGYHISALPQYLPDPFDFGVIGEGETTFSDLVSACKEGVQTDDARIAEIMGICYRSKGEIIQTAPRALVEDIDSLPAPLRRLSKGQEWVYLFTARGCPYKCSYCASHAFWEKYRFHSAEYVVNEIVRMAEDLDIRSFYSVDDLFIAPKNRLRMIVKLLEESGWIGRLRFKGFVRVNLVDNEVVHLLKKMGFIEVRFGMETASERLLRKIKDQPFSINKVEEVIDLFNASQIPVCGSFMFGIPGETESDIMTTRDFLLKHQGRFYISGFYLTQAVPGSALWDECVSKDLVNPKMDFSSLELDLSRKEFDWSNVNYLNKEGIPFERFQIIIKKLRNELLGDSSSYSIDKGSLLVSNSLRHARQRLGQIKNRIIKCFKTAVRIMFAKMGYQIIRFPQGMTRKADAVYRGIRLYIGSGTDQREGFLNCDIRPMPGVEVVCDAWEISKHCFALEEIYSRHMLEHLTLAEVECALTDWFEALAEGGKLHIIVPNLDYHLSQWARAEWTPKTYKETRSDARYGFAGLYGWQRECDPRLNEYNKTYWDVHKTGFNEKNLRLLLERAGFSEIIIEIKEDVHLEAKAIKIVNKGERQVTPFIEEIRADHRGRYLFAINHLKRGRILDIACGIGYGSKIMAAAAPESIFIGVDINGGAIKYANEYFNLNNITYLCCDALKTVFSEKFDSIVSFETLEHLENYEQFVGKLLTCLKDDGILIISTPNEAAMPFDKKKFPYHCKHFSKSEMESLLHKNGLSDVAWYSQHDPDSEAVHGDSNGKYLIAVARR
jgi:radical SAM superfamily enzyme YgiQ (UPF0313 family)/2-polyprenyl-3-methyl-5-hydroxy-6-metoxy-1,4-benzoquinol methylase